MLIGVATTNLFTLLIPLVQSGEQLIVVRLLTGLAGGFAVAAPFPIAAELLPAQHRRTYGAIYEIMLASARRHHWRNFCSPSRNPVGFSSAIQCAVSCTQSSVTSSASSRIISAINGPVVLYAPPTARTGIVSFPFSANAVRLSSMSRSNAR
jgi:MFS family permease